MTVDVETAWCNAPWPPLRPDVPLRHLVPKGIPLPTRTRVDKVFWAAHMVDCFRDLAYHAFVHKLATKLARFVELDAIQQWLLNASRCETLWDMFCITPIEYFEIYGY